MIVTTLFLMYEKPVRPGVYKWARIDGSPRIWSKWDGQHWCVPAISPSIAGRMTAERLSSLHGPRRVIGWRGLAESA